MRKNDTKIPSLLKDMQDLFPEFLVQERYNEGELYGFQITTSTGKYGIRFLLTEEYFLNEDKKKMAERIRQKIHFQISLKIIKEFLDTRENGIIQTVHIPKEEGRCEIMHPATYAQTLPRSISDMELVYVK